VRRQLSRLMRRDAGHWDLVAFQTIRQALPAAPPPHEFRRPVAVNGLLVAGDHRDSPSLQGAMVSGRRAADAALARLR
jgi:Flavin containing amine oxidoreductase